MLLNSAGKIEPDYQPPADGGTGVTEAKSPPPRLLVEVRACCYNLAADNEDCRVRNPHGKPLLACG